MGLLDRVKQNQTGVPAPAAPATNGPAASAPGTAYAAATAIPVARPSAPIETAPAPSSLSSRAAAAGIGITGGGGEMSPAFTAAKVQIHAKLIEKFADQIDSSNKPGVREKIVARGGVLPHHGDDDDQDRQGAPHRLGPG